MSGTSSLRLVLIRSAIRSLSACVTAKELVGMAGCGWQGPAAAEANAVWHAGDRNASGYRKETGARGAPD